jgi:hypothetical protein
MIDAKRDAAEPAKPVAQSLEAEKLRNLVLNELAGFVCSIERVFGNRPLREQRAINDKGQRANAALRQFYYQQARSTYHAYGYTVKP